MAGIITGGLVLTAAEMAAIQAAALAAMTEAATAAGATTVGMGMPALAGAGAAGAGAAGAAEGAGAMAPGLAGTNLAKATAPLDAMGGAAPMMPPGMGAPPGAPMPESPPYADIGMFKDPSLTQPSPMDALLNTDWDAAVGKATGYLKLAKAAGDFGSLMKGEPKPDQKLSAATAPLNRQQTQTGPTPGQATPSLPSTNLVPQGGMGGSSGMTPDETMRLRMMRGY